MIKEVEPKKENPPRWVEIILTVSFIFYIWYLGSTLLLPLSDLIPLPEFVFITLYKLANFSPSILGFIICVSIISSIVILSEFNEQKTYTKLFLIEGITFFLYFIIPIIATIFLLVLFSLRISGQIPSEVRISYFLEDLFLFTSAMFVLTAVLNVAMHHIMQISIFKKKELPPPEFGKIREDRFK